MTDSQEHDDATKIILKPAVVKKIKYAMITLFLCIVGIIVVLSIVLGILVTRCQYNKVIYFRGFWVLGRGGVNV
jgi:hypothetical protein